MEPAIKKILASNRVDGIYHTHVSLIQPKGKFLFNRQTQEEFWKEYCTYIHENKSPCIGIAEKPSTYLPVLADVDLCMKQDVDTVPQIIDNRLYSTEQLKTVVGIYQSVLREIVEGLVEIDLNCIVLEKKMYQQTKNDITYLKNGFHLHFPYIFLSKVDQETQVIPRVKQKIQEIKLFESLGKEDSGAVIDSQCCKVPWLLYGSKKDGAEHNPYLVTGVYDANMSKITLKKAFRDYQLFDHKEKPINIHENIEYYLPRILSIMPYGRTSKEIKRGIISPLREKIKKERKSSTGHKKLGVEEVIKIAKRLLPMLGDFRASDRNEWLNVGWILFNETDGHPDGLDLWCEFSSRCEDKYDENVCIHEWERMAKGELSLGTLRYMAGLDNPVEYKKYKDECCRKHVDNSLEGSHNDIAKALFAEYSDEFVCSSYSNRTWYWFHNHIWEYIEDGVYFREKISGSFVSKYVDKVKELYDSLKENQDKSREAMIMGKIKFVQKMIQNLKNCSYKNNIMKEASEVFYDHRFKERIDTDPYLIAFKNGVYDLKRNLFRPGRPEDFLSKQMPINYIQFSDDDERILDVHTFFEQVFPDKSLRQYFMDLASDVFVGGNFEKIVQMWTGEGDNAKSVTQTLFEKMLGKLAIKLNTTVITGKKPGMGAANAELARAGGGVRWAVMEEPDGDEAINVGIFKSISGNDAYFARDLFEKGKETREISPLYKLIFVCLCKGTHVNLPCGFSVPIEKLQENNSVMGYNMLTGETHAVQQLNFHEKGVQKCVKLTLEDNREIICTSTHKFLEEGDAWIEAENIIPGVTILKSDAPYPKCPELCENHVYTLDTETEQLDMRVFLERIKAVEYCQKLGLKKDVRKFLFSEECPIFLVKAFMAGFFSGNPCGTLCVDSGYVDVINLLSKRFGIFVKHISIDVDRVIPEHREKFFREIGICDRNYSYELYSDIVEKKYGLDLPIYERDFYVKVISIEDAGEHPVYDLTIEEPYSNFLAEGIVTHNCNKLPRIKYADKAVWNRVRVIPFESTFCRVDGPNPPPDTYEEQLLQKRFPMDKHFSKKIPQLIEPLAWILLQHRQKGGPRIEPEKVRMATEMYKRQNDIYRQFVEERIIDDPIKVLSLMELYNLFKDWFKESIPGQAVPNKNEIEEYFVKLWGIPETGKKWPGHRVRTIQDDIASGKAIVVEETVIVTEEEIPKKERRDSHTSKKSSKSWSSRKKISSPPVVVDDLPENSIEIDDAIEIESDQDEKEYVKPKRKEKK